MFNHFVRSIVWGVTGLSNDVKNFMKRIDSNKASLGDIVVMLIIVYVLLLFAK